MMTEVESTHVRGLWLVAVVGIAAGLFYAAAELESYDWDPVGVVSVGELDPVRVEYVESVFERDVALVGELGHDGKFFFIQAMDPLLLNPDQHARYLDRPTYRAQRMLYPTLAGMFGVFGAEAVAWAMLGINVAAFGIGTAATAELARSFGLSRWWGLAFTLNPAVRFELDIDGGGAIALAALMVSLWMLRTRRYWPAVGAMTAAALGREALLLSAAGLVFWAGFANARRRFAFVAVPASAAGLWALYVQARIGGLASGDEVQEIGPPLGGFIDALPRWLEEGGINLAVGVSYLFFSIAALSRITRRRSVLELGMIGFAVAGFLLTRQVWANHFDITRALSPLPTLLGLSLATTLFARGRTPPFDDSSQPSRAAESGR